ncbi:MAG: hypothetical protein V4475_02410 [Pseudomonadota bacterium]
MKIAVMTSALILLAMGGCDRPSPQNATATRPASGTDDYLRRMNGFPVKQREAVFLRAINDAGLTCQAVNSSETHRPVQGYPAWVAHCSNRRNWVLILLDNGIMQVATPAQLAGATATGGSGNEATP